MDTPEQTGSFFRLEQPNAKMQSEIIKVPDSKRLLTIFSELSNEDTQKAIKQFVIWMEKNNYNTNTEWTLYFLMFLQSSVYCWWISSERTIDNYKDIMMNFNSFFDN
jgi:hypothetical protein